MRSRHTDIVRLLIDSYSTLTPELQKAAQFMVENPEEIGLNSMRAVAARAGVKPATISRLSKSLGFAKYEQLREPFRQRLRKNVPEFAARLQAIQRRGADAGDRFFAEYRAREIDNIERTLSEANYSIMLDAAKAIHGSRRVYVLGLRGAYAPAFLFHYAYQFFQENSRLLDTRAGVFAEALRGIDNRDCLFALSFSPYTQLTIDAIDFAAEAGARIIALTDSMVSPAAQAASHTIIVENSSASFYHSFTGALAATQALIALLVTQAGGDAVDVIKKTEQQLSRISAYW